MSRCQNRKAEKKFQDAQNQSFSLNKQGKVSELSSLNWTSAIPGIMRYISCYTAVYIIRNYVNKYLPVNM